MIRTILFFFGLVYTLKVDSASQCICTTVPCPVEGNNTITEGGGGEGYYYYTMHQEYPVVVKANTMITINNLDQGTSTTSCTQQYARMLDDENLNCDAGHILAHRLGGPGNQPINIFPQKPSVNRGSYESMENTIYKCIQESNETRAWLSWEFNYKNVSNTRPYSVIYSATFSSGSCEDMVSEFDNEGI